VGARGIGSVRRTRLRAAGVLAALLAFASPAGCGLVDPDDPQRDELESARQLWEEEGLQSYRTTEMHVCFCGEEVRGPVQIRVSSTGTTRTYVSDGRAVPANFERFFPTVEELFDEIESALDEGADRVTAAYHPDTGAPLDVFIDWDERSADEEDGWTLTPPEPL
jgi:hypothetical protein